MPNNKRARIASFTLSKIAKGKGGDKYVCADDAEFCIYLPQSMSRDENKKAHQTMHITITNPSEGALKGVTWVDAPRGTKRSRFFPSGNEDIADMSVPEFCIFFLREINPETGSPSGMYVYRDENKKILYVDKKPENIHFNLVYDMMRNERTKEMAEKCLRMLEVAYMNRNVDCSHSEVAEWIESL